MGEGWGFLYIKRYFHTDYLFVLFDDEIYTFNNVIGNQEYKHRFIQELCQIKNIFLLIIDDTFSWSNLQLYVTNTNISR